MKPQFPRPVMQGIRIYFFQHEVEAYLAALAGLTPEPAPPPAEFKLVRSAVFQAKLGGISRRTMLRRLEARALETATAAE